MLLKASRTKSPLWYIEKQMYLQDLGDIPEHCQVNTFGRNKVFVLNVEAPVWALSLSSSTAKLKQNNNKTPKDVLSIRVPILYVWGPWVQSLAPQTKTHTEEKANMHMPQR